MRQSELMRKVYEALNTYSGNIEVVEISKLSLKDYQGMKAKPKRIFIPGGGLPRLPALCSQYTGPP